MDYISGFITILILAGTFWLGWSVGRTSQTPELVRCMESKQFWQDAFDERDDQLRRLAEMAR